MHELSQGFSRLLSSFLIFVFYSISFFFFTPAIKGMDISIAYAIWAGLGTALITVVGIFGFRGPVNALKIVSLFVVVVEIIGLDQSDRMT